MCYFLRGGLNIFAHCLETGTCLLDVAISCSGSGRVIRLYLVWSVVRTARRSAHLPDGSPFLPLSRLKNTICLCDMTASLLDLRPAFHGDDLESSSVCGSSTFIAEPKFSELQLSDEARDPHTQVLRRRDRWRVFMCNSALGHACSICQSNVSFTPARFRWPIVVITDRITQSPNEMMRLVLGACESCVPRSSVEGLKIGPTLS